MPDSYNFKTQARKITRDGELQWGGNSGWDGEIAESEGIAISQTGVKPTPLLKNNLRARWSMVSSTVLDGNVRDVVGGHDAEIMGSPTAVTVDQREALYFDGSTDHLDIGTFDVSSDAEFTWTFWLKDDSTSDSIRRWIVTTTGRFENNTYTVREHTGEIQMVAGDAPSATTSGHNWKGGWNHYALVADGDETRLYENTDHLLTVDGAIDPPRGLYIGGYYADQDREYTNGYFSDVRVYNLSLSETLLNDIYAATV